MRRNNRDGEKTSKELVRIPATIRVECRSGAVYFESCQRCGGHPVMRSSYVPRQPVTTDFSDVEDYIGGILPLFRQGKPDANAACDCAIGTLMMTRMGLQRYDSFSGTSRDDTKHSLVTSELKRRAENLRAKPGK